MGGYISKPFDPNYVLQVLAEIWGREHGYDRVEIKIATEKDLENLPTYEEERTVKLA